MFRTVGRLFMYGLLGELRSPLASISSATMLAIVLCIFHTVWITSAAGDLHGGAAGSSALPASPGDMVWYLVLTELIALSAPPLHREMTVDITSGRVTAYLLRPTHYVWLILARGCGMILGRGLFIGVIAAAVTYFLTGGPPSHVEAAALAVIITPLAAGVLLLFFVLIGLTAAWLRDPMPVLWIFSKSLYLFGGLMVPLSLYPEWFQTLASLLPFKPILYGVASPALHGDTSALVTTVVELILVGAAVMGLALFLHHLHVRRILREGE